MTEPIRVLELRSVRGTGGGPEKTILQSAARADRRRLEIAVCYVRDARDAIFGIDARARQLGIDYFEVRERHSFDPTIWPALCRAVRDRRIDIVHAHDYKTDLLAYLLARRLGVTPMSTVHGWTGHSARERFAYYPIDRRLLARFPKLIAVSDQIKSELVRAGAPSDHISVILNAIDHRQFRRDRARGPEVRRALGLSPDDVVIGSVGRLEPQKRYDLLIDAVAGLIAARPLVRLVIAGDGSLSGRIHSHAADRLPPHAYRLLGHRDDVIGLHHAFDLYVQSSDYEGTSNAVLEAMAMETPIVATDAGGTTELVADGREALIVPSGDTAALESAIERCLADLHGTAARAAAARRRVETELSFDARTARVEAIYEAIGSKNAQPAGV